MPKKYVPIKYTSREFSSIKKDLIDYVKRYYPETYKDFSEASFGSLMIDTVSYIGDILSFYLDYQANESFLHTAVEYNNIVRLGRQLGYRHYGVEASTGLLTFYLSVPANAQGTGPDRNYMPILKKGSIFKSEAAGQFILDEDVDFGDPHAEVRVATANSATGVPLTYAVKSQGMVVSGMILQEVFTLGSFEPFKRIRLGTDDITDIISVTDREGHEYYEVDYLSQDVVWKPVTNKNKEEREQATMILKPFTVPRRFIVERDQFTSTLVFGSSGEIINPSMTVADPSNTVLNMYGKNYVSDTSFDPSRLVASDKFGVAPSNTSITIVYRANTSTNVNAKTRTVNKVGTSRMEFPDPSLITLKGVDFVKQSLECENEDPIIGSVSQPNSTEIKRRIYDVFATQNRAVTQRDYEALVYQMPKQFGGVKRCKIIRDPDSLKRNLNLYVISEARNRTLVQTNNTVKRNLKTWLLKNKMINDTIDIMDAKIVNIGIDFSVVGAVEKSKFDVLQACYSALEKHFTVHQEIGEAFHLTKIYSLLNKVDGVMDVKTVKVTQKVGGSHSDIRYDIDRNLSSDGRHIYVPDNVVMEIKFMDDIKGVVT